MSSTLPSSQAHVQNLIERKVYNGRFKKRLRTHSSAHESERAAKKARSYDSNSRDEDSDMTIIVDTPKTVVQEKRPAHLPLPRLSRMPGARHKLLDAPYQVIAPRKPSAVSERIKKVEDPKAEGGLLRRAKSFVTPAVPDKESRQLRRVAQSSTNLRQQRENDILSVAHGVPLRKSQRMQSNSSTMALG